MNALLAVLLILPAVVMYHRVDASSPGDTISRRLTISPSQFARELGSIHRLGMHTIGIAELARDLQAGRVPPRTVLLTFDDGYDDQFGYAFRILKQFGDRATFFINPGSIGRPGHLTWPQVAAMARDGMSIECHGIDHFDLASLSATAQRYEIDGCVRVLAERLRDAVLAYAYPSGDFDAATVDIERRAGVLLAFTTDPHFQLDPLSPYEIARIRVLNGMSDEFFTALLERARAFVDVPPTPAH